MSHIFAKHLIGLMKSTACFVLKLIKASVYVIKNWRNFVFKYRDSVWLSFKCLYSYLHLKIHYPVTPQFESINKICIYVVTNNVNYGD